MVAFNIVADWIAAISSISIYIECYGTKLGYPNEFQPISWIANRLAMRSVVEIYLSMCSSFDIECISMKSILLY